jgi:hypothetical protein
VPILFTIPFLLHIPALIAIPLGQHLLGLAATVMSGALVRIWFRHWSWFIVPVTLFITANPMMLWYEQTIMGESEFLFALIFLALAGTLWARRQSRERFWVFLAALVCAAGARPEGRLFFAFGMVLAVFVLWRQWRKLGVAIAAMLGVMVAGALLVRQSTAPQLLYASVIQLAPDHSRLVPGIDPYIVPLRDQVREQSSGDPLQLVKVSKEIRDAIDPYLWARSPNNHVYYKLLNKTLRNLCLDALLAHPAEALGIPLEKFRLAVDSWSAYQFNENAIQRDQVQAYEAGKDAAMFKYLEKGLSGQALDDAGMRAFIAAHYDPARVAWMGELQGAWNGALIWVRTADKPARHQRWVHDFAGGVPGGLQVMPGVPWFYPVAILGMLLAMVWPDPSRRVHLAWAPVMMAVWYAATFVGVTNARYRFVYEPFCFIYLCLLIDCVTRWRTRVSSEGALPDCH